ncbi:MAG: hypothetical protein KA973_14240 [Candidatus Microthrix sp.]|nr:hypothetical protein [Candidatus Microthrix sp.]
MAVTAKWYGKLLNTLWTGGVNFTSDTIKGALVTSSYTFDQDTHDYFDDITNEVTGTGYTAGGATLASKTLTYTAGTNTIAIDAADLAWTTSTITARGLVIYKSTGTGSTSPLIGFIDFGADVISTAGTFTVTFDAGGIGTFAVS